VRKVYINVENRGICVNDNNRYRGVNGVILLHYNRAQQIVRYRKAAYYNFDRNDKPTFVVLKRKKI